MMPKLKAFLKEKVLPYAANQNSEDLKLLALINTSVARASVSSCLRNISDNNPNSWEFSGFSQNGEDGITDYLIHRLVNPNRYFIEIGSANGIENNTAYLAHIKKYAGLMIEGNKSEYSKLLKTKPWLVDAAYLFVNKENLAKLDSLVLFKNPDFFSLDIDGNDFYILELLLNNGYKPKIIVVEYNSGFGPENSFTINYKPGFDMFAGPLPFLYYGVSITGWKQYLSRFGYRFITVDSNGVNAFFIDPAEFPPDFVDNLHGMHFKENIHQLRLFKCTWEQQFEMIKRFELTHVE